jgi:hypothetical protein
MPILRSWVGLVGIITVVAYMASVSVIDQFLRHHQKHTLKIWGDITNRIICSRIRRRLMMLIMISLLFLEFSAVIIICPP